MMRELQAQKCTYLRCDVLQGSVSLLRAIIFSFICLFLSGTLQRLQSSSWLLSTFLKLRLHHFLFKLHHSSYSVITTTAAATATASENKHEQFEKLVVRIRLIVAVWDMCYFCLRMLRYGKGKGIIPVPLWNQVPPFDMLPIRSTSSNNSNSHSKFNNRGRKWLWLGGGIALVGVVAAAALYVRQQPVLSLSSLLQKITT